MITDRKFAIRMNRGSRLAVPAGMAVAGALLLFHCGGTSDTGGGSKSRFPIPSIEEGLQIQAQLDQGHQPWRLDPKQVVIAYAAEIGIKNEVMSGDVLLTKDDSTLSIVEVSSPGSQFRRRVFLARLLDNPQNRFTIWFVVGLQSVSKKKA